jgi:CheY-like chemotaxis protein
LPSIDSVITQEKGDASTLQSNESTQTFIKIDVTDTGHGLSPESISKIFSEFIQFDPDQLQAGGGSGLGLWICNSIIKQHYGEIKCTSDGIGHGCCFSIFLPCFLNKSDDVVTNHCMNTSHLGNENSEQANTVVAPISASSSLFINTKRLNILIVDDSLLNRKVIIRIITHIFIAGNGDVNNIRFVEAIDGKDVVQIFSSVETTYFDLIILDNIMLTMHGPETALFLRNTANYKGFIAGITGLVANADIDKFLESGVNKVLEKPISQEDIETILKFTCFPCFPNENV